MEIEEIVRAHPKVEQHVYIIGSTRPETLLWIIDDSGTDSPFKTVEDIRASSGSGISLTSYRSTAL